MVLKARWTGTADAYDLMELVGRARNLVLKRLRASWGELLPGTDLSLEEAMVLFSLRQCDQTTPGELATRHEVPKSTMTGILDRLVDKGLVRRWPDDEDRRQVHVSLAEAGRDKKIDPRQIGERIKVEFAHALSRLAPTDFEKLDQGLNALIDALHKEDEAK
ncbi:MAG: MarR family winged helix-turn-helix transcriptional regulator [Sulfobacillus sp.]